jgi:hypothetical protein
LSLHRGPEATGPVCRGGDKGCRVGPLDVPPSNARLEGRDCDDKANAVGPRQVARVRGTLHRCLVQPGCRECSRFYSPDGSLTINNGTPAVGRKKIAEVAQSFMTAFPDLDVVMDDLVIRVDGAAYHWTLIGTNTGPGGTGNRVQISGFEVWKFGADELIESSRGYFDAADFHRQLTGEPR